MHISRLRQAALVIVVLLIAVAGYITLRPNSDNPLPATDEAPPGPTDQPIPPVPGQPFPPGPIGQPFPPGPPAQPFPPAPAAPGTLRQPEQIPMPDLRERTPAEAQAIMFRAGWQGDVFDSSQTVPVSEPADVGVIVEQTIPPGQMIEKRQPITVTVGTRASTPTPIFPVPEPQTTVRNDVEK